ncbi:hypothetical protein KQI84_15195 [bacterium]|nr:hypothetical protein [bacterium]
MSEEPTPSSPPEPKERPRTSPVRVAILLLIGVVAIGAVWAWRLSKRPPEVTPEHAKQGIAQVEAVLEKIDASDFGQTERGQILTARLRKFIASGHLRFSPDLRAESILWDQPGLPQMIYIGAMESPRGATFPNAERLAKRLYHEALHAEQNSKVVCLEEECDAFTAAEEASAAVAGRKPRYPVLRDNEPIWDWVNVNYTEMSSNENYRPVGRSHDDLAEKAGEPLPQ